MSDVDTDGCQYKIIAFLLQHAIHFFFPSACALYYDAIYISICIFKKI